MGERGRLRYLRLEAGRRHRASARREARALHRRRHLARLRAPAGRGADRALRVPSPYRRRVCQRRRAVARPGRRPGEPGARNRSARRWRHEPGDQRPRRDPRGLAQDLRPYFRGDLCARGRGRGDRPVRTFVELRRAGARAAARVRHVAPHRNDKATNRIHARRARPLGERSGSRRGPFAGLGDQPGAYPRREPAIVPLGHGAAPALAASGRIRGGDARAGDIHGDRERAAGDERGGRTGGEGRLVRFALALALALFPVFVHGEGGYPPVRQGVALQFPRDHGSHPQFRSEWWYITGWLKAAGGEEIGVQITFFRNRPGVAEDVSSRFAPRQLLFAHAALADPGAGKLLHDQRAARGGFGLARAEEGRTEVAIEDWSLRQTGSGYEAEVAARDFRYRLRFEAKQPMLLQGERGFSRKGPNPAQASYYYSLPHLAVAVSIVIGGRELEVSGEARLHHQWSSEAFAEGAAGWGWIGINLAHGGALPGFPVRPKDRGRL